MSRTTRVDAYYTPEWLAESMALAIPPEARSALDLAAGQGALLEAVERLRPGLALNAVDRDRKAVRYMRSRHADWTVSCADALSVSSLRATRALKAPIDSIILNPPFSYRGGARLAVQVGGTTVRATPATAFVASALEFLSPGQVLCTIVPRNAPNVRGDRDLWTRWCIAHQVEPILDLDRNTFGAARTTATVMRIVRGAVLSGPAVAGSSLSYPTAAAQGCVCVDVIRGRVPRHHFDRLGDAVGVKAAHSTDLRNHRLGPELPILQGRLATVHPSILLPRVGKPIASKVVVTSEPALVLSDCVIAIRVVDESLRSQLFETLRDRFELLARRYMGSCAPYITVDVLVDFLRCQGFNPVHAPAGATRSVCSCRGQVEELATA